MMTSPLARLVRAGAVAGALLALGTTTAHAADGAEPTPLRAADRAAATQAAGSDPGLDLARRVATLDRGASAPDHSAGRGSAPDGATPRLVAGTTTEVHVLARDFVADGSGPVGELGYVATTARVDDQLVSVWSARTKGGSWRAVNAATGDVEARMARAAGPGSLLSEPQVGAWYAITDGRVRPLNAEGRKVVGSGTTLQAYQQIVHDRYADKLPGSRYDEDGYAGGFEESAPAAVEPDGPTAQTAALGLGGATVVAAAGAVALRRRSARR